MEYEEGRGNAQDATDASPPVIGKDEMNLAEFPFALLSKRVSPDQKTFQVVQEGRDSQGHVLRQEWLVTGSEHFGLPVAADDEVYVALMKLLRDNRFASRTVQFTVAQLLRIMQSGTGKRDYERVGQALDRLTGVLIRSTNAFWDHARQRYVTEGFHLLDSYRLMTGGAGRELSEATFSEFLFSSIQAGYVKNLDIGFYFRLSTALARRYYRLLDKHRYRSRTYEVEIHRLAQRLPLQDLYVSQLKRRLDPVHAELVERGFLEGVDYRSGATGETIVRIRFTAGEAALGNAKPEAVAIPACPAASPVVSEALSLEERLRTAGVSRKIATELAQSHAHTEIERQLGYLPHVSGLKNPGGYLRLAIENGYGPPPGWAEAQRKTAPATVRSAPALRPPIPPDPSEVAWAELSDQERTRLLIRAETSLRATQTLWQGSRRIPLPLVQAHARHLLSQELTRTARPAPAISSEMPPRPTRQGSRPQSQPNVHEEYAKEDGAESLAEVRAALASAPFMQSEEGEDI